MLKSLANGNGIYLEIPKAQERYRVTATFPSGKRESFEMSGVIQDALKEAQRLFKGARLEIKRTEPK